MKLAERTVKLRSLKEAISVIPDGARIAFSNFSVYQSPMAAVHEIIRAGIKDLTIVGVTNSIEVDMLVGAGAVKKLELSYVGLEKFGMGKNFRRAMQEGRLELEYYTEYVAWDRFRASREGMEFWAVDFLGGSDLLKNNPNIVPFKSPMSGKQMWAIPAANVDFAIIHAYASDVYGNIRRQDRTLQCHELSLDVARGSDRNIVTVERIIDEEEMIATSDRTLIPAFKTESVCHVPGGSHPTLTMSVAPQDDEFFQIYVDASANQETFNAFLDKFIRGTSNFEEYMALVEEAKKQRKEGV